MHPRASSTALALLLFLSTDGTSVCAADPPSPGASSPLPTALLNERPFRATFNKMVIERRSDGVPSATIHFTREDGRRDSYTLWPVSAAQGDMLRDLREGETRQFPDFIYYLHAKAFVETSNRNSTYLDEASAGSPRGSARGPRRARDRRPCARA